MSKSKSPGKVKSDADKTEALPDALRHFDELPDSANVRTPIVRGLFGISTMTVLRWSKSGRLPTPKKIGPRTVGWNVGELRRALRQAA
jgi:predicted DNA-binding transcriptional regulator AlpA